MRKLTLYVSLLIASAWTTPSQGQFVGRKARGTPAQRVPELLVIVKTDQDERKRAAAAEELREFDGNTFPEIASMLADVAKTDARVSVRQEAIESLSRLRPASQLAAQTLQWAAHHDESWKVRLQARTALLRYSVPSAGKTSGGGSGAISTHEPPLLDPPRGAVVPNLPPPPVINDAGRGSKEANPAAKAGQPGLFGRILPGKKSAPATPVTAPKNPGAPLDPTPPGAGASVNRPGLETPPPIVIEVPPPEPGPAPAAPPKADVQKAPAAPRGTGTEPNFRPAGQAPRPGFSTAVPQPSTIAPPPKNDDVPILIPPK